MNATLKVQREVAFGKKNLTANANVTSACWAGRLTNMYRLKASPGGRGRGSGDASGAGAGSDSFLQRVVLPDHLHTYYGAPSHVWVRFDIPRAAPASVKVTLSMFNKTRTRLPEAHWMDFEVAVPVPTGTKQATGTPKGATGHADPGAEAERRWLAARTAPGDYQQPAGEKPAGAAAPGAYQHPALEKPAAAATGPPAPASCGSWTVSKLSSTFCATDVSLFGSTHIHAVSDAGADGKYIIQQCCGCVRRHLVRQLPNWLSHARVLVSSRCDVM